MNVINEKKSMIGAAKTKVAVRSSGSKIAKEKNTLANLRKVQNHKPAYEPSTVTSSLRQQTDFDRPLTLLFPYHLCLKICDKVILFIHGKRGKIDDR